MFLFVIEVIIVAIIVSGLAYGFKLIPKYPRKYSIVMQLLNSGLLTVIFTILPILGIYPSWIVLFILIFSALMLSVWITNHLVRANGETAQ